MTLRRLTLAQSWGFGSLNIYIFGYLDVTQLMHFPARAASILFCPYLGINLVSQNPQLCSKEKSCKLRSSRPSNTGNIFRATCRAQNFALQVEMVCCTSYHLLTQQINFCVAKCRRSFLLFTTLLMICEN